jgi:hypothetical protein
LKQARDVGAALTARAHDLACAFRTASEYREESPHSTERGAAGRDVPGDEPEGLERPCPVDVLDVALEIVVVGAEQGGKSRRVARAAEVFHEQRVEQRGSVVPGKADDLREAHPDERAPHRVTGPLTLRQIESVGKPRQELRQARVMIARRERVS